MLLGDVPISGISMYKVHHYMAIVVDGQSKMILPFEVTYKFPDSCCLNAWPVWHRLCSTSFRG